MRKALFFLGILDDHDLEWMIATGRREEVPANAVLIREGQSIDSVHIVLDGAFRVFVQASGGQEIARLLSGEVVGEMSFVDSRPPSASVAALEDSRVLSILRDDLTAKLAQDVSFAARFYHALAVFLADRLRSTTSRLAYGETQTLFDNAEYEDELDMQVLDNLFLAGARFDMILRRLRGY